MKVHVDGKFYVGWTQFDPERLGVGLDRNIVNNDKTFYSVDGGNSWNTSSFPGSVMIRPVFSTSFDAVIGLEEKIKKSAEVSIYPNPTNNVINVAIENGFFEGAEILNMQGQIVLKSDQERIDVSQLQNGIYFVRLVGHSDSYKIIKQ